MASLKAELLLQLHDAGNPLDGSSPASEGSNAMTVVGTTKYSKLPHY